MALAAQLGEGVWALTRRLRWLGLALPFGLLFLYFGYHAIHGQRGLLAFFDIRREVVALEQKLAVLRSEEQAWRRKVQQLSPDAIDPDVLEEELKRLGYIRKDEVIVLEPTPAPTP